MNTGYKWKSAVRLKTDGNVYVLLSEVFERSPMIDLELEPGERSAAQEIAELLCGEDCDPELVKQIDAILLRHDAERDKRVKWFLDKVKQSRYSCAEIEATLRGLSGQALRTNVLQLIHDYCQRPDVQQDRIALLTLNALAGDIEMMEVDDAWTGPRDERIRRIFEIAHILADKMVPLALSDKSHEYYAARLKELAELEAAVDRAAAFNS